MAGLQRSEVSFRRSGSSGLVWDDKVHSGELNKVDTNQENGEKVVQELPDAIKVERPAYRVMKVASPVADPPSPKASAGCCGGVFGKPKQPHRRPQASRRRPSSNF